MPNVDTLVMEYYCNIEAQTAVQALKSLHCFKLCKISPVMSVRCIIYMLH